MIIYSKSIFNRKKIVSTIARLKIDDLIYFGGFVSREKAFKEVHKSDFAVHIGENLHYPTIAFKVWDYLSCGKKNIISRPRRFLYSSISIKKKNWIYSSN